MNQKYHLVCASQHSIPDVFEKDLIKILNENQLSLIHKKIMTSQFYFSIIFEVGGFPSSLETLDHTLGRLSALYQIDIGFIPSVIFNSQKKLAIFDMDSTLITSEVIDEMALCHGVGDKVKLITARAMGGELRFDQSLSERVALLKGFERYHMLDILSRLQLSPGAETFIKILQLNGIKTAIASGGFKFFAESIGEKLKMDYVFANDLEFDGEFLTGKTSGPIINAEKKEKIVEELAEKEGLLFDQIISVGDGANDIPMLLKSGMGIAIHAKEKVQKAARYRINFGPMTQILSYLNLENEMP